MKKKNIPKISTTGVITLSIFLILSFIIFIIYLIDSIKTDEEEYEWYIKK